MVSNGLIDKMHPEDWEIVQAIYAQGIATGNATFEHVAPDWTTWDQNHLVIPRLVSRQSGQVVGWAALSPVSRRAVYAGVTEVSIYVAEAARGQGSGTALLQALIEASEQLNIWTLQAGIFPENVSSLALHKRHGFREIGYRERVGQMQDGRWRDVILLERRSKTVGV